MNRRLKYPLLIFLMIAHFGFSQTNEVQKEQQMEQVLESIAESDEVDINNSTILEDLTHNGENPVNINFATEDELTRLNLLDFNQIQNIISYRKENGAFTSRNDLKKVPRLGPKAFEQCAGFLRIPGAENPLDTSAVHPERYGLVEKIAKDKGCKVAELIGKQNLIAEIVPEKYLNDEVGLPTLNDILSELAKPAPDPRTGIKVFEFSSEVFSVNDLKVGMILPGIVSNITRFGVFVDVGVKQDGLVHISEIANRFVSDPSQEVKLHQHVKVKVLEVDVARKRIAFSMKQLE